MLVLNTPTIEKNGDFLIIKASLLKGDSKRELFYAVDSSYEDVIDKSLNPFVFWAMLLAIQEKEDLTINGPCSKRFMYGIKRLLLPAFDKMKLFRPNILAKQLIDDNENVKVASGCATGLSGGIDSFCAVVDNIKHDEIELTHLFQFFADNSINDLQDTKFAREKDEKLSKFNDGLSAEFNLPVIKVYSNYTEDIIYDFPKINAYCYISHAMLLNGLISKYILASGYSIESFGLKFNDTSYYDLLTSQVVNRPDFEMIAYQPVFSRVDKTIAIAENEIVRRNLSTCVKREIGQGNCTVNCFKCRRTAITLDVIGRLDEFGLVYDVEAYKKKRAEIWGYTFYKAYFMHEPFSMEILNYIKEKNLKKPFGTTFYMILQGIKNQAIKLKRIFK